MLSNINNIHLVGIGGAGMSAIAKVLLEMGYVVSGSDLHLSDTTQKLQTAGATIFSGHDARNIKAAGAVVISSAIPETNPEITAARAGGIPVYHRSDILAALMAERAGIAVAGAHGKTTTTSMIAMVLESAGMDPTVISGGDLEYFGGNAKYGRGKYLVAEADESDGSFLKLRPSIAVVTNIEDDHLDHYKSMTNILRAFKEFIHKLPADGRGVVCFDNSYIREIAADIPEKVISYAVDHPADFNARNLRAGRDGTSYDVLAAGKFLGTVKLQVPGVHNVANSLAAVVVGLVAGVAFENITRYLATFQGARRRFQTKGKVNDIWVVDDYAHHPTEIASTLLAARQTEPKRLICAFQPHRYSRTKFLREHFGSAFREADILILTDIYSAGETEIPGITGEIIKEEVERKTGQQVKYIPQLGDIAGYLKEIARPGDLIMTMGAGNIYQVGEELINYLKA